MIIPMENEKDIRDIPSPIKKQIDIVTVEHMDEVLSHAIIVNDGGTLFTKNDVPFEITTEGEIGEKPANLI